MYQEIDFLEVLEHSAKCKAKISELVHQRTQEVELVGQKYKDVLDEFRPANEEMQRMTRDFSIKWKMQLKSFNKEANALIKRVKQGVISNADYETEKQLILEKYKGVLAENAIATKKHNHMIETFNNKWKPLLKDYTKEIADINKKYKQLHKAI